MSLKRAIQLSMVVVSMMAGAESKASDAECYRSDECPGETVCVDSTCVAPEKSLESCAPKGICYGDAHALCHDGFCKPGGVSCSNPAGSCSVDLDWGECFCWNGDGSGWMSNDNPPYYSDEELLEQCRETLVDAIAVR